MASRTIAAAVALAMIGGVSAARAKTLVYCSEGSPESFSPMLNTTGTTFDANQPIYDRLVEFKPGTTEVDARARGKLGRLGGRQGLHVPPAPQREVAVQRRLQADARLQRRRRDLHLRTPVEGSDNPYHKVSGGQLPILQRHGHDEAARRDRQGRRLHGALHAQQAGSAVPGRHGDGFRLHPVEGICRHAAEGRQARTDRPGADRHRALRIRAVPEGRDHPLPAVRRLLGRQAEDRRRWSSPSRTDPAVRLAKLQAERMPGDGLSAAGRHRRRSRPTRTCSCCSSQA